MKNVFTVLAMLLLTQSVFAAQNQGPVIYTGHCHFITQNGDLIDKEVQLHDDERIIIASEGGFDFSVHAGLVKNFGYKNAVDVTINRTGQPLPQGAVGMAVNFYNDHVPEYLGTIIIPGTIWLTGLQAPRLPVPFTESPSVLPTVSVRAQTDQGVIIP